MLQTELILKINVEPQQDSRQSVPFLLSFVREELNSASDTGYNE